MVQKKAAQSGQIGLVVLLIMVTVSVLGVSVASRATGDVVLSRQGQETARTFAAAESAIENVLAMGDTYLGSASSGQYTGDPDTTVDYTITRNNEVDSKLLQGSVAEIDLTGAVANNVVAVEWSQTDDCTNDSPASLLISVVNMAAPSPIVRYYSYAICNRSDGFTVVGTNGTSLRRRVEISLQAADRRLRITPVYNDTALLVQGVDWTMPVQGYTLQSVARNLQGRETQAIKLLRSINTAPSILDFAVVSGTTILK